MARQAKIRPAVVRQVQRHRITMTRNVHQILFHEAGAPEPGGYVAEAMQSVRDAFPRCRYVRWNLDDAAALIESHFAPEVLRAFECLRPFSYKADLFKYCVLQVHGGWYVDVGTRMLQQPMRATFAGSSEPPRLVVFRSTGPWDASWGCSLSLLYAAPGHEVLATAIDEVVDHCKRQHYGANPLSPTMTAFGRAVAIHDVQERILIGKVVDVEGQPYDRAHELQPLGHLAARKPRFGAGDLTGLGVSGTNDYAQMWRDRQVYDPW